MNNTDKDIYTNFKENNYGAIIFQLIEFFLGIFFVMIAIYTFQTNMILHSDKLIQFQWIIIGFIILSKGIYMITKQFNNYYYEELVTEDTNKENK